MIWHVSHRAEQWTRKIADRHYNRQSVGAVGFVPPGRCLVLRAETATGIAFWVTSWPFAEYVRHAWPGAWVCSAFRNEGAGLSSDLIRQAVAATRFKWPDVPPLGMITFVNRDKVRPKRDPGRCYLRAGFEHVGETAGGLVALQLLAPAMPPPRSPRSETRLTSRSDTPTSPGWYWLRRPGVTGARMWPALLVADPLGLLVEIRPGLRLYPDAVAGVEWGARIEEGGGA